VAATKVVAVDFIDVITPLPFMASPVEGLTSFRETPLWQVDAALAPGLSGSDPNPPQPARRKRLILRDDTGNLLALRVDAVGRWLTDSTQTAERPALPLHALWPRNRGFGGVPDHTPATRQSKAIHIGCADTFYGLPSCRVQRIEGRPDITVLAHSRRRPEGQTETLPPVPLIDTCAFLYGRPARCITHTVLLEVCRGQSLWLGVEALSIHPAHDTHWMALDWPAPLASLFDAAILDPSSRRWQLRVKSSLCWSDLPWRLKKALLKAMVGWVVTPGPDRLQKS
jgi:chemotaxis signal transduction protein